MMMPGRSYAAQSGYRYGFNGKENDSEVKGEGNQQDYGMRIYDPRLGRFLSMDPISEEYPELAPYQFASNRPIDGIDIDGMEWGCVFYARGMSQKKSTSTATNVSAAKQQAKSNGISSSSWSENAKRSDFMSSVSSSVARRFEMESFKTGPDPETIEQDRFGTAHAARRSLVRQNIKAINWEYNSRIGENIKNGPGGAIGYMVAGDKGSYVGATFDNLALSFGGVPGNSSVLSKNSPKVIRSVTPLVSLKNAAPNVEGKGYTLSAKQTIISNGKINVVGQEFTTGRFDYVITLDGKLILGQGHHYMSTGAQFVIGAGSMKLVNGELKGINNSSGHYLPTVDQLQNSIDHLSKMGVDINKAKVEAFNQDGTVNKNAKQ